MKRLPAAEAPAAAVGDLSKAIELDPGYAEAYHNRAVAHFKKGDYQKAWVDVAACRRLNFRVDPGLLRQLREASARDN